MRSAIDRSALGFATNTLNSLAHFLEYAELPGSSRQVRNMLDILQNIIQIEQQGKLARDNLPAEAIRSQATPWPQIASERRPFKAASFEPPNIVILPPREPNG